MLIDWFTVAAQLLNFLVLVWLMKRFLYQPVLAAIAAREQVIATGLADAAARMDAARDMGAAVDARRAAFDRQSAALLADAATAAQARSATLLEEGKAADAAQRAQGAAALDAEQARLCAAVTLRARDEVLCAVRQALADLGDASLEDVIVRTFIRRLEQLDSAARAQVAQAVARDPAGADVRTAFPLDAHQQAALATALAACGIGAGGLRFSCAPDLMCGIEIRLAGWSLAWNLDQFVTCFAQRSAVALHAGAVPVAA
jgi:F-type H+-transporting ATPase subunit b